MLSRLNCVHVHDLQCAQYSRELEYLQLSCIKVSAYKSLSRVYKALFVGAATSEEVYLVMDSYCFCQPLASSVCLSVYCISGLEDTGGNICYCYLSLCHCSRSCDKLKTELIVRLDLSVVLSPVSFIITSCADRPVCSGNLCGEI